MPTENFNPFGPGTAGRNFVGRERAVSRFRESLKGLKAGHPAHMFVAGLDGTGKTSYLLHVAEVANQSGCVAAVLTIDDAATADTLLKDIIEEVLEKVERQPGYKGPALHADWAKGAGSQQFAVARAERVFSQTFERDLRFLQKLAQELQLRGIVICLDEAQRLDPQGLTRLKTSLQQLEAFLVVAAMFIAEARDVVQEARNQLLEKANRAGGDYGAAGFLSTGVPMGPFESHIEAQRCITQRLDGNAITFSPEAVRAICEIANRVPRRVVRLAYHVYAAVQDDGASTASMPHVERAFAQEHTDKLESAAEIVAKLQRGSQAALRRVLELRKPVASDDIAQLMYPDVVEPHRQELARLIDADLALAAEAGACSFDGTHYHVPDPASTFALQMLLRR